MVGLSENSNKSCIYLYLYHVKLKSSGERNESSIWKL